MQGKNNMRAGYGKLFILRQCRKRDKIIHDGKQEMIKKNCSACLIFFSYHKIYCISFELSVNKIELN